MNYKKTESYAPVLIIAFNRFDHFRQLIDSLILNDEKSNTEIYIYIDGPKNENDSAVIKKIINYSVNFEKLFKKINIVERKFNIGLAKNITNSINDVLSKHNKIIVLEDDIIVSSSFLKYMNWALNFYQKYKNVWHINAHNHIKINYLTFLSQPKNIFLWRGMDCWGWATWKSKWLHYSKDPESLIKNFTQDDIYRFNYDNTLDLWRQVIQNKKGIIDTWAIFWYATIFKNNGLSVSPYHRYVKNIGFDGSGIHCVYDEQEQNVNIESVLNESSYFSSQTKMIENKKIFKKIKRHWIKKNEETSLKKFITVLAIIKNKIKKYIWLRSTIIIIFRYIPILEKLYRMLKKRLIKDS